MASRPNDANPSLLSSAATSMAARTQILRAVYGGTETMRDMEQTFLPKYEKESDTRYATRLASTFALNKLREAVDAASAKPFRTIIKVLNSDPDLDLMIKDIDLRGSHLHLFSHTLFNEAMLVGQSHILVDHPDTSAFASLGEQKAANIRPFWKLIKDDQVPAVYADVIGGDTKVMHVRIKSSRVERTPDFKENVINQIWVIEKDPKSAGPGIVQLYEQAAASGGGQWTLMGETPYTADEITFVSLFAGDREADYVTRPVFMDLAYKQIEHWQSSSDQRSILSAARFPMLAASGVQLDEDDDSGFAIGPYKVLYSPDSQGRWYYVEPKGTAIESGRKDLEMLELHMDVMALNPVTGTHRQYVPQNERDIQETRVHSVVHDMAISCEDAINTAIRYTGLWNGKDYSNVKAVLNKEFTNTKDKTAEMAQLIQMWEKRGLSREAFLIEAKDRNLLGDDFDVAAELALMKAVDDLEFAAAGVKTSRETAPAQPVDPESTDFPKGQTRPLRQV